MAAQITRLSPAVFNKQGIRRFTSIAFRNVSLYINYEIHYCLQYRHSCMLSSIFLQVFVCFQHALLLFIQQQQKRNHLL